LTVAVFPLRSCRFFLTLWPLVFVSYKLYVLPVTLPVPIEAVSQVWVTVVTMSLVSMVGYVAAVCCDAMMVTLITRLSGVSDVDFLVVRVTLDVMASITLTLPVSGRLQYHFPRTL